MLLIKNARILTMAGLNLENGCITVRQGKITGIYPSLADCPDDVSSYPTVIDAKQAIVMPGLIDAHCHIGITEEKLSTEGDDCNETTNPMTPTLRALDGINPMDAAFHNAISAGITSMMVGPGSANVVGGQFAFMKSAGRIIDRSVLLAPAAMKIAFGENPKVNYADQNVMPSTRMAIAAMLRKQLWQVRSYFNQKDTAREQSGATPDSDFAMACWDEVFRRQIPLKAHVHRADDILTAIRIAKEFDLAMTLDHCTEGHLIADVIAASGFPAIVGPSMTSRSKIEVQNLDFKTAGILHQAGVLVAICTDHPVTRIQYLPICAGLAAKEGLGIEEGLKAITINSARICRVANRVGSLEVGKDADIAIFSANPMETFTKTLYTIIDGKVVFSYRRGVIES